LADLHRARVYERVCRKTRPHAGARVVRVLIATSLRCPQPWRLSCRAVPKQSAQVPVADYIGRVPPSLRRTLEAGRKAIKASAPARTKEFAYRAWPIRYELDGGSVCGIGNFPNWVGAKSVSLYFMRGAELEDEDGILRGNGKAMRYVELREPKDADSPALKRVLRRAFRLGGRGLGARASNPDRVSSRAASVSARSRTSRRAR
jgi:hypothetical protein